MSESPRNAANPYQSGPVEPFFLGAEAPPLEGEGVCICGALEGEHQAVTGFCPSTGCMHFVAEDFHEEPTSPDLVVEYDAGVEPIGSVR